MPAAPRPSDERGARSLRRARVSGAFCAACVRSMLSILLRCSRTNRPKCSAWCEVPTSPGNSGCSMGSALADSGPDLEGSNFHSETKIIDRSRSGTTLVVEEDGELVATGRLVDCEILAVFVQRTMGPWKAGHYRSWHAVPSFARCVHDEQPSSHRSHHHAETSISVQPSRARFVCR